MNLDPPPSTVKLVTNEYNAETKKVKDNFQSNAIWTRWIYNLFEWLRSPQGFKAPTMTTAERDAMTGENGMIIYNSTTSVFNFYEAGSWVVK